MAGGGGVPLPLRRSRQNPVLIVFFYWEVNLLFQLNSDVLRSDWLPAVELNAAARNVKFAVVFVSFCFCFLIFFVKMKGRRRCRERSEPSLYVAVDGSSRRPGLVPLACRLQPEAAGDVKAPVMWGIFGAY